MMCPSTGILAPGLTLSKSPLVTSSIGTSTSVSPMSFIAVLGANSSNMRTACWVRLCALASKSWPKMTKVKITVVASK